MATCSDSHGGESRRPFVVIVRLKYSSIYSSRCSLLLDYATKCLMKASGIVCMDDWICSVDYRCLFDYIKLAASPRLQPVPENLIFFFFFY